MTRRNIIIVLTVLAVTVFVLRSDWRRATSEDPGAARADNQPTVLRHDRARDIDRIIPRIGTRARAQHGTGSASSMAEPEKLTGTIQNGDETAQPLDLEKVPEHMERRFQAESVDSGWSRDAALTIRERMSPLLATGSTLRSVECRASFCRIETSHAGLHDFHELVHSAFLTAETQIWDGGFFVHLLDGAGGGADVPAVAYLAREGEDLSAFDGLASR